MNTPDASKGAPNNPDIDPQEDLYAVVTDMRTGFVTGTSGTVLKTRDAGATWQSLKLGTDQTISALSFPTPTVGYAAEDRGTVRKTTDAGWSWQRLLVPTEWNLFALVFPTSIVGYIVGGGGAMFKTTDAGATWEKLSTGTSKAAHLEQAHQSLRWGRLIVQKAGFHL